MTGELPFQFLGSSRCRFNPVIVKQLFARIYGPPGVDKDAIVFFLSGAIRFARMIDPARLISAVARVDHIPVLQGVVKSVKGILVIARREIHRYFPRNMPARVLDDARATAYPARGVNPFAMNAGAPHMQSGQDLGAWLYSASLFPGHFAATVTVLRT